MDSPRRQAAIRVRLDDGRDEPALDTQLTEGLRAATAQGLSLAGAVGVIGGPLGAARRSQVPRLFEQLQVDELPAALVFHGVAPPDLHFLGQQARRYGFAISVGAGHITVTTPWAFAPNGDPWAESAP